MTIVKSTATAICPAERRGDDTHWWKAYQSHSKGTLSAKPQEAGESSEDVSLPCAGRAPVRLSESEVECNTKNALERERSRGSI